MRLLVLKVGSWRGGIESEDGHILACCRGTQCRIRRSRPMRGPPCSGLVMAGRLRCYLPNMPSDQDGDEMRSELLLIAASILVVIASAFGVTYLFIRLSGLL